MRRVLECSAVLVACSAASLAEPVRYENTDGAFAWILHELETHLPPEQMLDPTRDAAQDGSAVAHGIAYAGYTSVGLSGLLGGANLRIALGRVDWAPVSYNLLLWIPEFFSEGEVVGPGPTWESEPTRLALSLRSGDIEPALVERGGYTDNDAGPGLLLLGRLQAFVGIELLLDGRVHYGWVEVRATFTPDGTFDGYVPLRWAYETDADAALVIDRGCRATEGSAAQLFPGEVGGLRFADRSMITWTEATGAHRYHVYRGPLAQVDRLSGQAACRTTGAGLSVNRWSDEEPVPRGEGFFYLVSAQGADGREGTLGFDSCAQRRTLVRCSDP